MRVIDFGFTREFGAASPTESVLKFLVPKAASSTTLAKAAAEVEAQRAAGTLPPPTAPSGTFRVPTTAQDIVNAVAAAAKSTVPSYPGISPAQQTVDQGTYPNFYAPTAASAAPVSAGVLAGNTPLYIAAALAVGVGALWYMKSKKG